jgi:MarR family transcriptional regulator, lower aerobic nicotinate degradation pathway regulator
MAAPISTEVEVAEFAGQLLFRLWRASHTRVAEVLPSVGLTPALFAVLNVLGAREGAIQQQLSSDMGIDPSAMVKLIDELEGAGLAERRRRPGDRRAWEVTITPAGRRTLKRARQLVTETEDEVLSGLTDAERGQLLTLLRRALVSSPPQPPWSTEEED